MSVEDEEINFGQALKVSELNQGGWTLEGMDSIIEQAPVHRKITFKSHEQATRQESREK